MKRLTHSSFLIVSGLIFGAALFIADMSLAQSPVRQMPKLPAMQQTTLSLDALEMARTRHVSVRPLDRTDRQSVTSAFLQRLGERVLTNDTATEISLAVLYEANLLANRSQEEIDSARLDLYIAAAQQRQREISQGSKMQMVNMQNRMQQRSQLLQLATNLLKALADSEADIIRNTR